MIAIRLARMLVAVVIEPSQNLALTKGLTLKKSYENVLIRNLFYMLRIPVFLNSCISNIFYISCSTVGTTARIYLLER
jgi:hypothetical protein